MHHHAYLIMAHNNWNQLKVLLELLDDSRNDIFIHIDKLAGDFPEESLRAAVKYSNLVFISRKNIYWADFSQTDVELDLLEAASRNSHYHYYHLLSGGCLPLKTQDYIHRFFENENREFVATVRSGGEYSRKYIAYYHWLLHNSFYRKCKALKMLDRLLMYAQKLIGIDRLRGTGIVAATGWTWFSITDDFCRHLVNNRQLIKKLFIHTVASDEHIMGTIAVNSEFVDRIYDINDEYKNDYCEGCMRYIDWERGKPYVWGTENTEQDYKLLKNSKYLFARKFDERVNPEIIQRIYNDLKSNR